MGRMADARKRARSRGTSPAPPPPPAAPVEEPKVVSPPRSPGKRRLALPSSGLAAEILARPEAAAIPNEQTALEKLESVQAIPEPSPQRAQNLSFFSSPMKEERKVIEATEHLATFFLSGEEYGVDVRLVQEIIRVSEVTPIPRAPEFVKGVINLRGRIIPVVDLKRKLGLGAVEESRQARIVVVKIRERLIGLLVDGASQVLRIPVSTIEAAPEEIVEIDMSYIRGVAKLVDRLIILVDLANILSQELREGAGA
jgi:purine-binding chemotaxis protein CheW